MATNNAINAPFPITAAQGGTGLVSPTAHGILIGEGASAVTPIVLSAGQILCGTTASDPSAITISSGTGISVTSSSGSISIAATGATTWVDQTSASVTMAVNTNYIADNAGLVTLTVPATAALGDTFRIVGKGAGGWLVQANTGQTIHIGSSATTSAGSLASTNQYDCITFTCVTANTVFTAYAVQGNLTVA